MSEKSTQQDPLSTEAGAQLAHCAPPPEHPVEELLHELQAHHAELEIQNEELRRAQAIIEESRDRYVDFYDFAPIGFLTLTREALIGEINLTGAALLGAECKKLLLRRFVNFVAPEDSERWSRYFMDVMQHDGRQSCELALKRGDGSSFHALLDCLRMDSGNAPPVLYIAFTDITGRKQAEAAALQSSEEKFRKITESAQDAIVMMGADQRISFWNAAAERIFGYTAAEAMGQEMHVLITPPQAHTGFSQALQHFQASGEGPLVGKVTEVSALRKGGEEFPVELSLSATQLNGQWHAISIVRDITGRKRLEEELRIAAIAFESQKGMAVTDANGVIIRVNRAFTSLTGYSAEDAVGRTPALLSSGRYDKEFYQGIWATLKEKRYWQGEMWSKRKNGKVYAEWLTISAVTAPDGNITHYVGSFSEITQNKEAEAEIHRLAYYDPLTRLPNRRLLMDRLGQALASSGRSGRYGALLFLDLDNFKMLNDMRGHDVGDLLLAEIAQRLNGSVREGDTVVRLGGDEFVLMLEGLSGDAQESAIQAGLVGEKVRGAIAMPYQGIAFTCTASIGACLFCGHDEPADNLLKYADLAMYHAKKGGRNRICFFEPSMQDMLAKHSALENDLRHALELKQLRLYYQIQIDGEHRVAGAEALLRWYHPERGLIYPGEFIPLAEETGLIIPIGLWVLKTACAQIRAWSDKPSTRDLQLAVNVSVRQFHQPDFVEQVQQALSETGINPERLKIELTESLVLDNVSDTITKMHALKALGVSFSMDDFGTGYSSLSNLQQLPLNQLKIDQSFVRDLATNPNDAAIVRAIVTMARAFGLNVIAEGVETEAQRDFLNLHGCHAFQGHLFSKPIPIRKFEKLVAQYA
ncbi:MAG: EAL domain-containing protein [Gallionella sp.]|nr:MAG: EAL domain-containing protein [Gallionella sp.]